jgi:hypothetical protein
MKFYEAESTINADAAQVWKVLIDTASWPSWDSGVDAVEGAPALGDKIVIRSKAAPGRAFPVRVAALDAPRKLVFSGGMPLGLFRGVRTYTLDESSGSTRFHMREEYTGAMLGPISKSMPDLAPSFRQFADGLKARVESRG